jgi:predicted DsbA family dithiol-disulfide isomerase
VTERTPVRIWIDPSCPWAWQTATWLRQLRDRGLVTISWSIFSLELNASEPGTPFWEACSRHGEALVSLALARREYGEEGFEAMYRELGHLVHTSDGDATHQHIAEAASRAGMGELMERARTIPELSDEVTREFEDARSQDVFGVPTLKISNDKVIYGPLVASPPGGADAVALWEQTKGLSGRGDFFELKRWPRDVRPGDDTAPRPEA